jgi:hypothetical protein
MRGASFQLLLLLLLLLLLRVLFLFLTIAACFDQRLRIGLIQHVTQDIGTTASNANAAEHDAFAGNNDTAPAQNRCWNQPWG